MHINWFEDKINFVILPTHDNLDRFNRYANIYAEHNMSAASLACILCRLVVECKVVGSSIYGALSAYTGESTKIYYLPDLPMSSVNYEDLESYLGNTSHINKELGDIGCDLCSVFPLAKYLSVDPDHLLFVAIVAAELLMSSDQAEMIVPLQLDVKQIEVRFGL